jgi:hypothetical protein
MLAFKQDRKPVTARAWVFVIDLVVHPDAAAMTDDGTKHLRLIFFALVDDDMHMATTAIHIALSSVSRARVSNTSISG